MASRGSAAPTSAAKSRGAAWQIRCCRSEDLPALANIFKESVRQLGQAHYTPEQIAAWSGFAEDAEGFSAWISGASTFVATDRDGRCIGFSGLDDSGRVTSLYVAPECMRRGVASGLLAHVLEEAAARGYGQLRTEASYFSMPLFRRHGFAIAEDEHALFNGVEFHRFLMQRKVSAT